MPGRSPHSVDVAYGSATLLGRRGPSNVPSALRLSGSERENEGSLHGLAGSPKKLRRLTGTEKNWMMTLGSLVQDPRGR